MMQSYLYSLVSTAIAALEIVEERALSPTVRIQFGLRGSMATSGGKLTIHVICVERYRAGGREFVIGWLRTVTRQKFRL